MGSSEAKRFLAGFGIATLLAGVALAGCKSSGAWGGSKTGAGGTGEPQKQQQSSWHGKAGAGGAGGGWGGTSK